MIERVTCIETYTLPHVKQIASGNLLYGSGNQIRCCVTAWRGGIGWKGDSRRRGHMYTSG